MLRGALILALVLNLGAVAPLQAQDRAQTLADIRQELSVLFVELQRLRGELNTTSGAQGTGGAGTVLDRVSALEAELQRLSALTEELDLRINRVVTDGTNRVGDLEFRLCELEDDCDIGSLGDTPSLGGVSVGSGSGASMTTPAPSTGTSGGNLAVAEQSDFDRARTAYDAGNYAEAAQLFEAFTNTYPGGPLSAEAHYMRGQSEAAQQSWTIAARAFLESFSADPQGNRAADALVGLGGALGQLGQVNEACLTLAEVGVRFPGSPSVSQAEAARANLNCS